VRDDLLAQVSEEVRLVENPSSRQIVDVLCLLDIIKLQRGELADYCITQSRAAIVFVDDQGEIEELLRPDLVQVTLKMQQLA
jgi:hypothetical protein